MKKALLIILMAFLGFSFKSDKLKWVAIGDSITYLNDHPDETNNRITKGYMSMVCDKLPTIKYVNKGFNGWTSVMIAQKIDSLGLEKADIYTVFLGTNDWWSGNKIGTFADYQNNTGAKTIYGAFKIISNKLRKLNPNAHIVLITPMQRADFVHIFDFQNNAYGNYKPKAEQTLEEVANAIATIAKSENFELVDLYHDGQLAIKDLINFKRLKNPETGTYQNYTYPSYINVPFSPKTDEYPYPLDAQKLTFDGLHPSDKGYEIITDRILKVFNHFGIN